jgi:hypothetical protein
MSRIAPKQRILACRLTDEEERAVDAMARAAGVSPARFLRNVVIEKVQEDAIRQEFGASSWAHEFAAMIELDGPVALARFNQLRAGRRLPKGFMDLPRAQQVEWLDREWPL